jgi:hypothetical protein
MLLLPISRLRVKHMDFLCIYIQSDSKLLSGFPWPVFVEPYVKREMRMLELFSILKTVSISNKTF